MEKYIEKRSITISSSGVADHLPEVSVMSNEDLGFSEAGKVYFYRFQKRSILELIRILGSNKASKLDKLQALRNNDIIVDDNMEKEVGYMYNWGEYMWQGGLKEGLEQGINQGEEKLNSLYVFLMNDGKLEEMKRVMHDKAYRQELYKVYGL